MSSAAEASTSSAANAPSSAPSSSSSTLASSSSPKDVLSDSFVSASGESPEKVNSSSTFAAQNVSSSRPSSPTSASSRLWSAWISPSTSASNAASSQFEERKRRRRPSFEDFRAQEPPQARLIRLRGLFDVLLDKDDEQALAGGRAKEEWTRSAMRARYGAGGIYARGSLAPKREESKTGSGDVTFGFSSSPSTSSTASSPSASGSSRAGMTANVPPPPRTSYAIELLSQCRECRAQLEKERHAAERKLQKAKKDEEDGAKGGGSWTDWIPFYGSGEAKEDESSGGLSSLSSSITDTLTSLVGSKATAKEKEEDSSFLPSSLSSIFSSSDEKDAKESLSESSQQASTHHGLHSDHEGEAGWIGSGVWGLSAVGSKQRQADRERDKLVAKGHEVEDDGGRRQRQIEWEGFLRYADLKERELYKIFIELDKNGDMRLDTNEIATALDRASIELSKDALEDFITSMGSTSRSNGTECPKSITFPQFRDYLLLLPRKPSVNEIYRFYQVRKAFGLFGSQGVFAEFSDRWGKSERHGATTVTQDGDVSLAGEERKRLGDDEKEARREARRSAAAVESASVAEKETGAVSMTKDSSGPQSSSSSLAASKDKQQEVEAKHQEEDEEEDSDMIHGDVAVKFLLAGGIAGAVSRTATAPFDRLKIYLITSSRATASGGSLTGAAANPATVATRGVGLLSEAVQALYREGGGLKAFWVGNGLNCLKIFPESAIKFLSYETSKRAFAKYVDGVQDSRDISGTSRFLSGGIGGITSQFAIYPVETLKTRLMASQSGQQHGNKLLAKTARDMWQQGGLRTYYRGLVAGLVGVFPYSAIDMSTFEGIKLFYIKYTGREEPGVLALLAFGSLSGGVGATTVYPLSLIRTRLQAAGTPSHPQVYDGFWDACRKTYRQEGPVGFYRGLVPSLAKVVPAVSISYVVYEHSKRHLGVQ